MMRAHWQTNSKARNDAQLRECDIFGIVLTKQELQGVVLIAEKETAAKIAALQFCQSRCRIVSA
jgi:hypothetical protein